MEQNSFIICLLLLISGCYFNDNSEVEYLFGEVIHKSPSKSSKYSGNRKQQKRLFIDINGKLIGQAYIKIDSINEKNGIIVVYSIKDKQYHLFNPESVNVFPNFLVI